MADEAMTTEPTTAPDPEDRDTGVPDLIDRAALREAVKRLDFPSAHAFGTEGLNALSKALALIDAAPAAEPVPLTLDALDKAVTAAFREKRWMVVDPEKMPLPPPDDSWWPAIGKALAPVILAALARPEPSAPTETEPKS